MKKYILIGSASLLMAAAVTAATLNNGKTVKRFNCCSKEAKAKASCPATSYCPNTATMCKEPATKCTATANACGKSERTHCFEY